VLIQNIKIAADAMIFSGTGEDMQLLLIKRGNEPYKGMWAIPGGFVEDDEDLEAAAIRELEEETGLKVDSMTQLYTIGTPGRDPRGRTVSVVYYAFVKAADHPVKGGDDAAEAQWVYVKDITELAFDHMEVLKYAKERITTPNLTPNPSR
jgi:8-oxo-dGTP diphosphatase